MAISIDELIADLNVRRELALKRFRDDPLPLTEDEARVRLEGEIARYGLGEHVAELETRGYTILPPGTGAPVELTDRIRDAVARLAERRAAKDPLLPSLGRTMMNVIAEDPVFEEALMNPVALTLVTYLTGYRTKLMSSTAIVKTTSHEGNLPLHADASGKLPNPWPLVSQFANLTYVLTDYSRENGSLCVVPGSHTHCRQVPPERAMSHASDDVVAIEAPAGSIIVWHGNLWHGALARTTPGERMTLVLAFCRQHIQAQEANYLTTTAEMLERNPARFGIIMNVLSAYPWSPDGPNFELAPPGPYEFERWA